MKILIVNHHFAFDGNDMTVLEMSDDVDSEKAVKEWIPKFIKEVVPADEEVEFYLDGVIELTGENIQWKDTNIEAHYELLDAGNNSFEPLLSFTTQRTLL